MHINKLHIMKHIVILSCLFNAILFVNAQNIPNGDFENWRVKDHYKPTGMTATVRNAERTSDAKEGQYALKLSNTYVPNSRGYRSYAFNEDNENGYDGVAFNGEPLSLCFWAKYDLAEGDTARVYAIFREKGTYKGKVDFRFTGKSNNEWLRYSVPIEWTSSRTADSVWINLYSYADYGVDGDGFVIFDDIHFTNLNERQEDIFNHGFEDWQNIGVKYPAGWRTIELVSYERSYSFLYEPTVFNITESDVFMGENSLLVKNAYSNSSGNLRYGYCYLGTENNDYYTPHFPIDTFKYLQGYYKYLPDGDDTARINLRTWEKGKYKSNDNFYLSAANEWTFFAFPINYYSGTATADSAGLIFYSGKTDSIRGPNSSLYLDNLELVMQPKSLGVHTLDENISIYPNPFQQNITIESTESNTLDIYNTLGKRIATHKIIQDNNTLDVAELPVGIYYLKTRKQSWTKKVIKQ
jgi:hypothetical protein